MKIVCFGDSNTYGYDPRGFFGGRYDCPWPQILEEETGCAVLNWGENGREIPAGAVEFPEDADLLIIMLGTNDLLQGAAPETVCGRMERFLRSQDMEKILLIAPPPMKLGAWVPGQNLIEDSQNLADCYRDLAQRLGIRFADAGQWNVSVAYDGVHLTQEGHSAFALGLLNDLKKGEFTMLETGMKAPEFTLKDKDGNAVSLSDFLGKKVVLYFYPRDNTPGCTRQACAFAAAYEGFKAKNVAVIGVSKDSVASHVKFAQKYGLPFVLLSDPELQAIQAYGVWQEKKLYGKVSMGVVRTTFVIDEEGNIERVMPKVKPDTNAAEILAWLGE